MKLVVQVVENPRMARIRMRVGREWRPLTDWFGSREVGTAALARLRRTDTIDGPEARNLLRVIRETFPRLVVTAKTTNFVTPCEWTFQLGSASSGWFFHRGEAVSPLITDVEDAVMFLARAQHAGTCPEELVDFLVEQAQIALDTDSSGTTDALQ